MDTSSLSTEYIIIIVFLVISYFLIAIFVLVCRYLYRRKERRLIKIRLIREDGGSISN